MAGCRGTFPYDNSLNPSQKTCVFIPALLQGDPDSGRAVEETLQVKARERVRATAVYEALERQNRAGLSGFHHGECLQVSSRPRVGKFRGLQRLEGRIGSDRPLKMRSPTGRATKPSARDATSPLTQMRVPSCLLAASSRAAMLMVSP